MSLQSLPLDDDAIGWSLFLIVGSTDYFISLILVYYSELIGSNECLLVLNEQFKKLSHIAGIVTISQHYCLSCFAEEPNYLLP